MCLKQQLIGTKPRRWLNRSTDVTSASDDEQQSQDHNSNVTLVRDDGQQINAPKAKKRKWIKKSKYQRIQRQKKKKISVVFN